ncbi:MAG: hypothetical protein KDE56_03565 [Anaerolineales bacterium]|nr:hypothetical protein [Anaerolineales bacterium]
MLLTSDIYTLQNVWEEKSDDLKEEIIDFWLSERALGSREQAEKRVNEVVFVARDSFGEIAGICTAYAQQNLQLRHNFYHYRTFVAAAHRKGNIGIRLLVEARDYFNGRFTQGHNPDIIGIIIEIENKEVSRHFTAAIWPRTGFVFVGYNQRGDHVRVYYFDEAHINPG